MLDLLRGGGLDPLAAGMLLRLGGRCNGCPLVRKRTPWDVARRSALPLVAPRAHES